MICWFTDNEGLITLATTLHWGGSHGRLTATPRARLSQSPA